ncbi:aldehyde dehydrogenase PuuC [Bordetella holmesii]|uniref:Aldehyde dehydrogenase (NAD) family protein n=2 Tax=Bordetella holmesii TaxID=35814 RepID=A0A158M6X5_9BORD|nr:aldehyde dehydrogenase PuuC [Bordetella holmesii]KAK77427.1 aldehyde dehydrogenase (NAD) family protein [Bordetella holmesii CDC-H809-BH]KAK82709.1 aldehyde dehydrogenase (NAD) family protein [Bordetella holmesii CDC-H572-BH]KAK89512.1 aldehyde dehydrogenase (NAD) family protein [Bordetella holmesii H620]KAK95427.1 aldehyde dehydrogenase (NAD) family protein [Bordetella holmesii CDC-H585-BH]KAK96539.1 aldehyde dehydrogenase (NAD) family protein [Bordetella holmesii CDC-H635-BH]KCV00911.1 a
MMNLHDTAYWHARAASLTISGQAYIDGSYCNAADGATFAAHSPIDGRLLANIAACGQADVDRAVAAARRSFEAGVWANLAPRERKARLLRLAALIEQDSETLALLETLDMGKPIRDALSFDLPETARCYAWYGEAIDKQYDEIAPTGPDVLATITREPLGVVAAVVPWNYPLMMAAWKLAPALAAGNSVVLKPAEQASLSALRLAGLTEEEGIPPGVFNVVPGLGPVAGQALGRHDDVDCLAFTGSTATGKRFMEYAGQSNLKRVWLECGGKSPHIVFDDCPDLPRAAEVAALAIFSNQGEVCIAGSRLYVQAGIYDRFMSLLAGYACRLQPGDPLNPDTPMGAIVDERQMQGILARIDAGCAEGATLRQGGRQVRHDTGGYYIEPTIVECTDQANSLVREEVFGPVLAVQRFTDEDEAIRLANDSAYGLGAGLWTAALSRAHRLSRRLRAGLVWVNCYADGDISVPFGGVKQSGFGRDKSLHALDKYTDLKTTWISLR